MTNSYCKTCFDQKSKTGYNLHQRIIELKKIRDECFPDWEYGFCKSSTDEITELYLYTYYLSLELSTIITKNQRIALARKNIKIKCINVIPISLFNSDVVNETGNNNCKCVHCNTYFRLGYRIGIFLEMIK